MSRRFGRDAVDRLAVRLLLTMAVLALVPLWFRGAAIDRALDATLTLVALAGFYAMAYHAMRRADAVATEAERAIQAMREAQVVDAEDRARRLQQVGARVAHELKNPLAAIKGLVQLVARGAEPARAARLEEVLAEIGRVEDSVRAYLSFARPVEDATAPPPAAPTLDSLRHDRHVALAAEATHLMKQIVGLGAAVVAAQMVLFGLGGLPTGRLVAAGAAFAGLATLQIVTGRHLERAGDSPRVLERFFLLNYLGAQVWIATMLMFTGGIRSPLMPTVMMHLVMTAVLELLAVRRAVLIGLSTLAMIAAIAAAPVTWTGPGLATWHHDAITLATLIWAVVMVRTVTAAIANAADRAAATLEQVRAERLRDSDDLTRRLRTVAARVADELRPPLDTMFRAITAELATASDERVQRRLTVVAAELARMQVIVGDYLSATRPLEDLDPEPVDVATLAAETAAVIAGRAEAGAVTVELAGRACPLSADPRRLREALLNLLSNALDATPAGGTVRVETAPADGGGGSVTISDTGRGMSAADLARIGTSFFTTRADGTGLGVSLVQGVVAQHGGTLTYASEPGRGTRVTITLPGQFLRMPLPR